MATIDDPKLQRAADWFEVWEGLANFDEAKIAAMTDEEAVVYFRALESVAHAIGHAFSMDTGMENPSLPPALRFARHGNPDFRRLLAAKGYRRRG